MKSIDVHSTDGDITMLGVSYEQDDMELEYGDIFMESVKSSGLKINCLDGDAYLWFGDAKF